MQVKIVKGNKTALLFGATGLVGNYCLQFLLQSDAYKEVIIFTRKDVPINHKKLTKHVIDFDELLQYKDWIKGDDLYCCLGTTIAKAGSKAAFQKVDYTYTYEIAKMASKNKVSQLLLVSAVGADRESLFFYNRVKGKLEDAIKKLDFWALHIFQPSVLLGERNENRFGEQLAGMLGKGFDYLTNGMLNKYRPIEADLVAQAMINAAQEIRAGQHIYPSHWLQDIAKNENAIQRYDERN